MRRTVVTASVAALMGVLLFTAAPAQALASDPGDFGGNTPKDFRLAATASLLENVGGADQKGYDAKFANMVKYNLDPIKRSTKFRPPISNGTKLVSRAGGVATGLLSYPLVIGLANTVSTEAFGIDLQGQMCKNSQAGWMSVVTGLSCEGHGPDSGWVANVDAVTGFVGGPPLKVNTYMLNGFISGAGYAQPGNEQDLLVSVLGIVGASDVSFPEGMVANRACLKITTMDGTDFLGDKTDGYAGAVEGLTFNWEGYTGPEVHYFGGGQGGNFDHPNNCGNFPGTLGLGLGPGNFNEGPASPTKLKSMQFQDKTVEFKEGTGDPDRRLECTVTTTSGKELKATGGVFRESSGAFPAPTCPALPPGEVAQRVKIDEIGGTAPKTIADDLVSPEYTDWATAYPECGSGACLLDLRKVTGETTTESCFDAGTTCADWLKDPNKTDNYKCMYGTHSVALKQCNMYGPTFKPGAVEAGQVYGDPTTGEAPGLTNPSTVPSDVALYDAQVQSQENPRQCYPQGWAAMNPVEWVMKPTMCALEWAFVPTPAKVQEATTRMKVAWDGTPMVKIGGVIDEWGSMLPHLDGCEGPRVHFEFGGMAGDFTPLNACEGPLATAAPIARLVGACGMYLAAFLAITKYLGAAYGYRGLGGGGGND